MGYHKAHPEIPELSEKATTFILRCFESDPDKRATAEQLLEDPFLCKYSILTNIGFKFKSYQMLAQLTIQININHDTVENLLHQRLNFIGK